MGMLRAIALLCPIATRNQYTDIKNCFFDDAGDSVNVWFKLFCQPDGWTPNDTYFIDGEAYEPTFRRLRQVATIEPVQRGYSLAIATSQAATFFLAEELAKTYRPISVRDYLRVERANYLATRNIATPTTPFTDRQGIIYNVEPAGALVGTVGADLYIPGGFKLEFREGIVR
jgi:hypothetical protein